MLVHEICGADMAAIERYNSTAKEPFKLRTELGPSPFEGDIESSPIVLLFANPGFDETSSTADHHFTIDGWPLAGLHQRAPVGMRDWWRPRLRVLCERYGDQYISTKVAALQINPWASMKFDANLRLPSRRTMLEIAEGIVRRGAILVVMRAERQWLESDLLRTYRHRYRTRAPRCSYITEPNLGSEAWAKINSELSQS